MWLGGKGTERVGQEIKKQKYEDYIAYASPQAAAVGRREPYYLTYLRKRGMAPGFPATGGQEGSRHKEAGRRQP